VPLHDASGGAMRSLHARSLAAIRPGVRGKAVSSKGYEVLGLVMANAAARVLLRGQRHVRLRIVQGVPDFLTAAALAQPVLGIVAGSWTAELAARVPEGTPVEIATHADAAGERYAAAIRGSLPQTCVVTELPPDAATITVASAIASSSSG
jgi:hypothetical protein